jgi:hypothetical protein
MSLAQVEAELIRQTLVNVTSNRTDAAKQLGISRRALQYKIKRYGLGIASRHHAAVAKHEPSIQNVRLGRTKENNTNKRLSDGRE